MEMMRGVAAALLLACVATTFTASAEAAEPIAPLSASPADTSGRTDDERLVELFADDARRLVSVDPLEALYRGEEIAPADFAQLYTDALDQRALASATKSLRALEAIDRSRLSEGNRISYDVFARAKREDIAWLQNDVRALTKVRPFNHFGGLPVEFPTLMSRDGIITFAAEADYRRALALNAQLGTVIDSAIRRFRQGAAAGVVEPKLTVSNMIAQIDMLLAQPVEQSPFYSPVLDFPATIPAQKREDLRSAYARVITGSIYPAYRRLRGFLAARYLRAARSSVGISAMPGGPGIYRRLIERETTLPLDPEALHRLGIAEVARIQREMEGVRREIGYDGTLAAFFDHIRDDPRFHPRSRADLERGFAEVARKVDDQVPRFFARLPRTRLQIQPYPAYREQYEPGGSYQQGSADGSRPGIFYFNAYDLPSRFLTGMTTLYLHEGVPGHHFQISLARENEALPDFQREGGNNAFVEGWALYAETLGYDMGLYRDPMQHWGTLDDEMLRAMRLVVDTGLHAKGWSREQAIAYMLANSGMGRTDAAAEVDRYIANPAQALSYKVGSLTIQRLRRKAEAALGPRFDIRAFHDQVLSSGALPLTVLEAKIDAWIASAP